MHLQPQGATQERSCEFCQLPFTPRRPWSRFCGSRCRNGFHAAEARNDAMRAAAPDLYEAALAARKVIRGRDLEHAWLNAPETPALTLGALLDRALAKAGYREPRKP